MCSHYTARQFGPGFGGILALLVEGLILFGYM
jgi:hypothetical protein